RAAMRPPKPATLGAASARVGGARSPPFSGMVAGTQSSLRGLRKLVCGAGNSTALGQDGCAGPLCQAEAARVGIRVGGARRQGWRSSKTASGPHEALDGARQHEQIRLAGRSVVLVDLL